MNNEEYELLNEGEDQEFVFIANEILRKCKINGKVESLSQCSDSFFIAVYDGILGEPLKGIIADAVSHEDKIHNCDVIIDSLSCDVLNVDLSHITGEDIVYGDVTGIQNLLEIFQELLDFILDIDENPDTYRDEKNDSNLISNHEVISDVLEEELGSFYGSLITQRKLLTTKNSEEPLSSQSSSLDDNISMIPKWSRSVASSQSSRCDSNSTGEIIRESELLECQLAREYPSLHKLKEQQVEYNRILDEPQESARGTDQRTVTKGTSRDTREPTKTIRPLTTNRTTKRDTMGSQMEFRDTVGLQMEFRDSLLTDEERVVTKTKDNLCTLRNEERGDQRTDGLGYSKVVNKKKSSNNTVSKHIMNMDKLSGETVQDYNKVTCGLDNRLPSAGLLNHSLVGETSESDVKQRGEKKITGHCKVYEKTSNRSLNDNFDERSNVTEEIVSSKLDSRTLGIPAREENKRSGLGNTDDDGDKGKVKETCEETNVDGSDTSGVLWDDQISPLDASEKGIGLAFDMVGIPVKRMGRQKKEIHNGVGGDKHGRASPVVRHYHHHFHHPHERSDDLIRERIEKKEHQRPSMLKKTSYAAPRSILETKPSGRKYIRDRSSGEHKEKNGIKDGKKRYVKFKDDVDMVLITNRLERLKNEMERDEKEQGDRRLFLKSGYGRHLDDLNTEYKKMEKELKQTSKTVTKRSPPKPKCCVSRVLGSRVQAVYGKQVKRRKARFPTGKARRRCSSSSVSPKEHTKRKTVKQIEKGDILLPTMLDEFPFLHLSPHTMQIMRKKQTQQLLTLSKTAAEQRQTKTQKTIEDAEKRQETLLKILRKDVIHNQRMREQKERKEHERAIKSTLRDKRQASARARRYYEDYQLRMRAKLLKRRTREEQVFKNLFQDGLEIQKERVRELRTYAKEQREMRAVKEQDKLESLENYYHDQYSMLTSAIAHEKEALEIREKAQEKVIQQMQRNLRQKLQKEVTNIQETLIRDEDDAYFRRLDAERLRRQMKMAAFQNLS